MRDDDAAQAVGVLQYIGVIRQDEVDARVLVIGKHEAGIDENDVTVALEGGHVLADGIETAERYDPPAVVASTRALALRRRFRKRLGRSLCKALVVRILFFWHEKSSSACDHVQVFFVFYLVILRAHRRA